MFSKQNYQNNYTILTNQTDLVVINVTPKVALAP